MQSNSNDLRTLEAIEQRLSEAACHIDGEGLVAMDELFDAVGALSNYIDERQREARTEYAVQAIDKANEAKGEAIKAVNEFRKGLMTPEEYAAQLEADNEALFGKEV